MRMTLPIHAERNDSTDKGPHEASRRAHKPRERKRRAKGVSLYLSKAKSLTKCMVFALSKGKGVCPCFPLAHLLVELEGLERREGAALQALLLKLGRMPAVGLVEVLAADRAKALAFV